MDGISKSIEKYNPNKKPKKLVLFYDVIADMLINKKFSLIVSELFIRGIKLNIFLVFITQSYFAVPKIIRQNSTHYFLMKVPFKRELHRTTSNHSSDINSRDMNLYKKCTAKPYFFSY